MDTRVSTSTLNPTTSMVSKTLSQTPQPFTAFRPSPLNPESTSPLTTNNSQSRRSAHAFPASRPLRPFPSIAAPAKGTGSGPGRPISFSGNHGGSLPGVVVANGAKKPSKTIEISSKWKGGFFVLGMTQAEFSRRA